MTFDPTKPVMTRDDRKARIICTDRRAVATTDKREIVALIDDAIGGECPMTYRSDGRWLDHKKDAMDLINVERIKVEVDVWRNRETGEVFPYDPKERKFLKDQDYTLLATKTIEFDHPAAPQEPRT